MTLRMADGPPTNLPAGLDAYAGYVNRSGIGITWPQVVADHPGAHLLSITTDGATAMCADVESGAMVSWAGYDYGYCSVSNVNRLIGLYGRPAKLWTAHADPAIGSHICSPTCWPGLVTTADGTQWTDHGGLWDESLLADDFFTLTAPSRPGKETAMLYRRQSDGAVICIDGAYRFSVTDTADYNNVPAGVPVWEVSDAQFAAVQSATGA